jgi:putative spermidine/putrescine transport system permease protein
MKQLRRFMQAILTGIWALPFLLLLVLSVGRHWPFPHLLPREWTSEYWQGAFSPGANLNQSLLASLLLSMSLALVATALGFFTSRQVAYHPKKGRWLLLAYFPYAMAPVILAACLQHYFLLLGWSGKWGGVWLAQLCIVYPFAVIFFSGFWDRRMRAMEELVITLGGTTAQAFRKALLPLSKGALLVCFFQTFLLSWFEYGLTSLIGVGKVQTLTVKVFQYVQEANVFQAALAGCLLFLPPLVLWWLNKRLLFKT